MLSHEELLKTLSYDPETGILTWLISRGRAHAGQPATSLNTYGYLRVGVGGHRYLAHRLIWFYMTGRWPTQEIDHKDRDPANNRWTNLREATSQQNKTNSKSSSKHGLKGVGFDPRKKKPWLAQMTVNYKTRNLGWFATKEEAHQAYCEAAKQLHGDFFNPS